MLKRCGFATLIMATAMSCLVVNVVSADGGAVGHIYAGDGQVTILRACQALVVRDAEVLRISDTLLIGPASHASVRAEGFGHLDLGPETLIQINLFYRSPRGSVQESVLEFSIFSGSVRFVGQRREGLETRFRFNSSVIYMRGASIDVEESNGVAVVKVVDGETTVATNSQAIRGQRTGDVSYYFYQARNQACDGQSE